MNTYQVKVGDRFHEIKAKTISTLRKRLIREYKSRYYITVLIKSSNGDLGLLEIYGGFAMWYSNITYTKKGNFTWKSVYEVTEDGTLGNKRS